jgi:flagellar motor switch protein FliN/FliY
VTNAMLIEATTEQLAAVIEALLDAPGTARPSTGAVNVQWAVSLAFTGPAQGTVILGFEAEGAQSLAKLIMALEEDPTETAVADTLLEVCGQALSAVGQRNGFEGIRLVEAKLVAIPPMMEPTTFALRAGDRFSTSIASWAFVDPVAAEPPAATVAAEAAAPGVMTVAPANLDLILDIDLPLTVRFGETEMSLHSLTRLAPGSIIDLGRSPDDPVDILVNSRLVARGEVVVVGGNYGVRIVEVISTADRLKTVAA